MGIRRLNGRHSDNDMTSAEELALLRELLILQRLAARAWKESPSMTTSALMHRLDAVASRLTALDASKESHP